MNATTALPGFWWGFLLHHCGKFLFLKEAKVDITINEIVVFPIQGRAVLKGYDEYSDLPEDSKIRVYALEEILTEKVVALSDRARNEPRDLYDVWYLTSGKHVELSDLIQKIESKLKFRGRTLAGIGEEFEKKFSRYKKPWNIRLAAQISILPHYDSVVRSVKREFRLAGLM